MIEANGMPLMTDAYEIVTTLRDTLEANGVHRFYKTIKTHDNVMTCCPFHKEGQEKKPSFGILEKDGTCHCFACGWVGSIQEMISLCFGHNDLGAFGNKWLAKNFLAMSIETRPDIELDITRGQSKRKEQTYVSEEELDKYRWTHPYWAKRKITDSRLIELFDLGYDKDTDCITFPVRDIDGKCLFVARRNVKTKFFNYPEGVEKPLYGIHELKIASYWFGQLGRTVKEQEVSPRFVYPDEVIVCESMIDALTCWQYGKYAVAMNGLGTELQMKQLRELPCRSLILATDMDEAGLKAREKIQKAVKNKIIYEYVWDKHIAKDINDMSEDYFKSLQKFLC